MNEVILSIVETDSEAVPNPDYTNLVDDCSGFVVTTDEQVIKLLIDNYQQCCESWGYFMSEDDTQSFVGSTLRGISVTTTALKTYEFGDDGPHTPYRWADEDQVMFVNLETSRGLLQFVAYNYHSGYYGHAAYLISEQLQHHASL